MSYKILNTDGTTLLILADGQIDTSATGLTLIGKNRDSYGEELNNNFIKLLANFASTTGAPPRSPIKGQLWYDTSVRRLKIYDNGFKVVSGVAVASSQPPEMQAGDLWFDSINKQLKLYSAGLIYTIGPAFPDNAGENSWVVPNPAIKGTDTASRQVLVLKSYGQVIALASANPTFIMDPVDAQTYMIGTNTNVVAKGMTVCGDLSYTGKFWNNYLSTTIDLDALPTVNKDATEFTISNAAIVSILNKIYPPNQVVPAPGDIEVYMTGLFPEAQLRVLCKYSLINSVSEDGYQIRIFKTVDNSGTLTWAPVVSGDNSIEI